MGKSNTRKFAVVAIAILGIGLSVRACGTAAQGSGSKGPNITINGSDADRVIEQTVQEKINQTNIASEMQDRMLVTFETDSDQLQDQLQQQVQALVCNRANNLLSQWEQQNAENGVSVIRFLLDKHDLIQHEASVESRGIEQYSADTEQFGMARNRLIDAAAIQTALNGARAGKVRLECAPLRPVIWAEIEAYVVDSYRVIAPSRSTTEVAEGDKASE